MGIMNAPMMLAASSGDDVDFMVHGLIPLKFFGHKVWITTTHVTTADRYGVYHRISIDRKTCSSSR